MVTVYNKKELLNAIEAGETEIKAGNKKMQAALSTTVGIFHLRDKLGRKPSFWELGAYLTANAAICGAVTEGTIIILTIVVCVTAFAIVAVCKDKKVKIKYLS